MGRVKLPISRIVNNTNRQVTFSKRRNGILKKAYELAILCDIDIALFMISPSGRISLFSGTRRIEDVIVQYFNSKDEERESDSEVVVNDKENVVTTLMRLKNEETALQSSQVLSSQAQEYKQEVMKLQQLLELAQQQLRVLEPDPQKFTSLDDFNSCEQRLSEALRLVEKRKKTLVTDQCSSYQDTGEQINTVFQYINNAQTEDKRSPPLENPDFGSWVDHVQKLDLEGSEATSSIFLRNPEPSNQSFPSLLEQKSSVSLNGMPGLTQPSHHTEFASSCPLPPKQEDNAYNTKLY
ncbi:OLC1v1009174C1 [Oldenlandia corymbosa var. corymbosa]|uniref:OLC1v1009174C1 n=1 Tax=Oldenlandia corymbosa var. corymbosa TaxID=529605 RepID=A0AAV1DRM0_OLDCO|nr:OLC1v1009174C1 [Oldenlandia corymbosa var. corymbosa]